MRRSSGTRFLLPFVLGTVFGAVGGAAVGALVGHRAFAAAMHLASLMRRRDRDELRFDLLLQ